MRKPRLWEVGWPSELMNKIRWRQDSSPGHRTQTHTLSCCVQPSGKVFSSLFLCVSFLSLPHTLSASQCTDTWTCRSRGFGSGGFGGFITPSSHLGREFSGWDICYGAPGRVPSSDLMTWFLKDFLWYTLVLLCVAFCFSPTLVSQALVVRIQLPTWCVIILSFLDLFTMDICLCAFLGTG